MITTVTLNAAIDKTYYVGRFDAGKVNRVPKVLATPGGKGINVARVLRQLGAEVKATGFVGGKNGEFIAERLEQQGVPNDFVQVEGESRLCLNIIDADGASTELLEPGPEIPEDALQKMKVKIRELARESSLVVMSGSLPAGVPDGYYAELIREVKAEGRRVLLDTSKTPLLRGIEAVPYLIKPNEDEVKALLDPDADAEEDLCRQVLSLHNRGIAFVVVTLGARGAIAGVEGRLYRIHTPKLQAVNTVGCGDAFVAGMAYALERGFEPEAALRQAAAAGSANALTPEAGNVRPEDVERLLAEIRTERIEA